MSLRAWIEGALRARREQPPEPSFPLSAREEAAGLLRLAERRAGAAEQLWQRGITAEALRLAKASYEAAEAARALASPESRGGGPPLGLRRDLDRLSPLPELVEELSPAHHRLYLDLLRARRQLQRRLEPATLSGPSAKRARAARWARGALILLALLALTWGAWALSPASSEALAVASAVRDNEPELFPDRVQDGDPESRWALPTGQRGWIELHLRDAREITSLRLLNGALQGAEGQATERYRVELFRGGHGVAELEGSWTNAGPEPAWREHSFPPTLIDRVRVTVLSWHGEGGALAEIELR